MSADRAALVREAYAARSRGGEGGLLPVADAFEVDDHTLPEVDERLTGPDALQAEWSRMRDAFEEVGYRVDEIEQSGPLLLVRATARVRGKGSGIPVEGEVAHLWTFDENGRATRLEVFGSWREGADALRRGASR